MIGARAAPPMGQLAFQTMPSVAVAIVRSVEQHPPGIVECVLIDAFGCWHPAIEKAPVVASEDLGSSCASPQAGAIACEVPAAWREENGRALVQVDGERRWGSQSTGGISRLVVLSSQMLNA